MEEFPSDLELNAASALLILSCEVFSSTTNSMSIMEENEEEKEFERELQKKSDALELSCFETSSDDTTLCNSSIITDDSVDAHHHKLVATDANRFHEMKLKVARRARTKVIYRSSGDRKPGSVISLEDPDPGKAVESETTTTTEGSCLSSGGSSEISSAGSEARRKRAGGERKRRGGEEEVMIKRRGVGSAHIRRRAEAIMRFLSVGGSASEVLIRQVIGDSPDTSKALRMLLKMEEVKRSGLGGRSDPFIYKVSVETDSIIS